MPKKHSLVLFISLASLLIAGALSTNFTPKAQAIFAAPDGGCWCTTYVANHYHLPSDYPNAYQWSSWLRRLGWRKDHIPHVGDIEVLQPKADGANKSYGHVGVVWTAEHTVKKLWTITLRGAYQQLRPEFRDADCGNVSDWTSALSMGHKSGVTYFYKRGVSRW
jgi:CHAP domain